MCVTGVCSYHYGSEVLTLKAADGMVQRLVHRRRDPLGDQTVQVDGATEQLEDTGGPVKITQI